MTRPQIIRADTLDLQDKTSPTAQDHSKQPQHPAPLGIGPAAPHQEASMRLVNDERNSEESHMHDSNWSDANTLREDPGSDDERTVVNGDNGDRSQQQDETAVRLNGGMTGDGDDEDMQDADEEDMDDDMMDKISSSPSIDDGGYSSTSPLPWPKRRSSLSPNSSPALSPNTSAYIDSSSPFIMTPIHFPIPAAAARRPCSVPAGSAEVISMSPYRSSPIPFSFRSSMKYQQTKSAEHHRGEYAWPRTTGDTIDTIDNAGPDDDSEMSPRTAQLAILERRLQNTRQGSQMSLMSDFDEEDARLTFQPVRSPLRDASESPFSKSRKSESTSVLVGDTDEEDDGSWTTESDADAWDEENDDDANDISFSNDSRFVDSGWGGECLREIEDIDFEFVYALHTFVATVEGQANATKGDTMVLLDDSNSYWWLVRVVKDSSIGYLPAEHIETPSERLARLNKHRNIDLSATMLGDTGEKTKNPLKKAIRRRNAKTVQFAPPTYVEASDYDYSSDEGGDEELFGGADPNQAQAQTETSTETTEDEQDGDLKVQPLKVGAKQEPNGSSEGEIARVASNDSAKANGGVEDTVDRPMDPKVSRNGTLRNTDSFFKDENTETRKITLTPNLLRDDSSTSTTGSKERGPSLESLEKNGFADKIKDDKKKKEKKSGMLSGLFKRKEKKPKELGSLESFDSDTGKQSEEYGRSSPQSKRSDDISAERPSNEQASVQTPQRQTSKGKLQKPNPTRDDSPSTSTRSALKPSSPGPTIQPVASKDAPNNKPAGPQSVSTMRLVAPEQEGTVTPSSEEPDGRSRVNMVAAKLNPIDMLKSQPKGEPRPEKTKKAKQRVQLDDFDSEEDENNDPFADPHEAGAKSAQQMDSGPAGRLSESPVHVSAADAHPLGKSSSHDKESEPDAHQPPGLTGDTSSQETSSPISTPTPNDSPSTSALNNSNFTVSRPAASPSPTLFTSKETEPSPPPSSETTSLPAWSDSSLRTYLDDGTDLRDLMLIIRDTTGVVPVGPDHPVMSQLFVEETKTVSGLSGELDGLLKTWLEKKRKTRANAAPPIKALR